MKNLKQVAIYGVLIWVVAFIVASVLVGFKVTNAIAMGIIISIALVIFSVYFSKKLRIADVKNGLATAGCWFALSIILDLLVTARFTGFELFTHWTYWASYLFLVLPPMVMPLKAKKGGAQGASVSPQPEKT